MKTKVHELLGAEPGEAFTVKEGEKKMMTPDEAAVRARFVIERDKDKTFTEIRTQTLRALLEGYRMAAKRGAWKPVGFDKWGRGGIIMCAACHNCSPFKSDFCPRCGADMRGPEPGGEK